MFFTALGAYCVTTAALGERGRRQHPPVISQSLPPPPSPPIVRTSCTTKGRSGGGDKPAFLLARYGTECKSARGRGSCIGVLGQRLSNLLRYVTKQVGKYYDGFVAPKFIPRPTVSAFDCRFTARMLSAFSRSRCPFSGQRFPRMLLQFFFCPSPFWFTLFFCVVCRPRPPACILRPAERDWNLAAQDGLGTARRERDATRGRGGREYR